MSDGAWSRAESVADSVKADTRHGEERGYTSNEGRITDLTNDLHMAALSARMAMAATRVLQSPRGPPGAPEAATDSRRLSFSEEEQVPHHVAQLNKYLDKTPEAATQGRLSRAGSGSSSRLGTREVSVAAGQGGRDPEEVSIKVEPRALGSMTVPAVSRNKYQVLAGATILLNMVALCYETDHAEWPWWNLLNGVFLLIYIVELGSALYQRGPTYLFWLGKDWRWMIYDALVVALGIVDFAASFLTRGQLISEYEGADAAEPIVATARRLATGSCLELLLVRFLMLSRLLRLYRIVRMQPKLYDFVRLLMSMLSTFVWILSIIFLFVFVQSIVLTRVLGHGLLVHEDPHVSGEIQALFSDIPTSLFTLFQLVTVDDWSRIATPVLELHSGWRIFFITFITFMSWTMLSLLTAVASETMLTDSKGKKNEETILAEVQRQGFTTFICGEFIRADADSNGLLDKDEFINLMSQPSMIVEMQAQGVDLKVRDLSTTWDTFDVDDSGELTIDELVDGFSYLMEDLGTKHVATVQYALKRWQRKMEVKSDDADSSLRTITDGQDGVLEVLRKRQASTAHMYDEVRKVEEEADLIARAAEEVAAEQRRRAFAGEASRSGSRTRSYLQLPAALFGVAPQATGTDPSGRG